MHSNRLPRFKRVAKIARIQLTERDQEILRQVQRHRFLRSSHVVALIEGSRQHVLRRLQLLYHHGYLERPRAQLDYFHQGGSRSIAYGLGNKGATVLKRESTLPSQRKDWSLKSRGVGRMFLEHALLITDIMVGFEVACRRLGNVRLLSGDELPQPEPGRRYREQFQWSVVLGSGRKLGVIPDRAFGLEFTGSEGKPTRVYYFLEADRGTMPVKRHNLSQSSFYRKMQAYEATWTQNLHRSRLGLNRFRVLTVTSSPERVKTLVEACRQLERGRGLFLFSDAELFRAQANPLALPWVSAREDAPETILDSFPPSRPFLNS